MNPYDDHQAKADAEVTRLANLGQCFAKFADGCDCERCVRMEFEDRLAEDMEAAGVEK